MRRAVLAACLLAILSTATLAASTPADKPEPDPRLDQKVTVKAVGMPLEDLLGEITEQTGVEFVARKDVADVKVAVFVKAVPLSSLKDALKECLHLQCTREGRKDQWIYQYWEDLKTRQEASSVSKELTKRLHEYTDSLSGVLADIEKEGVDPATIAREYKSIMRNDWTGLDSWPNRKLFDRFPSFGELCDRGALPAIGLYANLSQEQRQSLWQGQPVTVQLGTLSPDLQRKMMNWCGPYVDEKTLWLDDTGQNLEIPSTIAGIVLQMLEGDTESALSYTLNFATPEGTGGGRRYLGAAVDSIAIRADDLWKEQSEQILRDDVAASESSSKPVLLDVKKGGYTYDPYPVIEMIHDKGGASIVSDYYSCMTAEQTSTMHLSPGRRFATWDDALKFVAVKEGSYCNRNGKIRVLTSRTWSDLRSREIPERLLVQWRKAKKQNGELRLQEAFELADLNEKQLTDLDLVYKIGRGQYILECQSALKFAGALNKGQLQQAIADQGLSLRGLTADQLDLGYAWASKCERRATDQTASRFSDREQLRGYTLRIYRDAEEKQLYWHFLLIPTPDPSAPRTAVKPADSGGFNVPGIANLDDVVAVSMLAQHSLNTP